MIFENLRPMPRSLLNIFQFNSPSNLNGKIVVFGNSDPLGNFSFQLLSLPIPYYFQV